MATSKWCKRYLRPSGKFKIFFFLFFFSLIISNCFSFKRLKLARLKVKANVKSRKIGLQERTQGRAWRLWSDFLCSTCVAEGRSLTRGGGQHWHNCSMNAAKMRDCCHEHSRNQTERQKKQAAFLFKTWRDFLVNRMPTANTHLHSIESLGTKITTFSVIKQKSHLIWFHWLRDTSCSWAVTVYQALASVQAL